MRLAEAALRVEDCRQRLVQALVLTTWPSCDVWGLTGWMSVLLLSNANISSNTHDVWWGHGI